MNPQILNGDTLKPRDGVEKRILERIGRWTVLLLQHRQKTQQLVTSEEIMANDKKILGNMMGERLTKVRKERGFTQEQLETKSKVSQSKISRIEAGTKTLSIEDAKLLAPALKVSMKFLISGKE